MTVGGGILDGFVEGGAAAGGRGIGVGLIVWTAYKLFVFVCNFLAGRHDVRHARLDALEVRLTASLGDRLSHLEQAEINSQARIQMLEGWVATLATELRMQDPTNPKLKELSDALRGVTPLAVAEPMLDEILHHAANAVERKGRRK